MRCSVEVDHLLSSGLWRFQTPRFSLAVYYWAVTHWASVSHDQPDNTGCIWPDVPRELATQPDVDFCLDFTLAWIDVVLNHERQASLPGLSSLLEKSLFIPFLSPVYTECLRGMWGAGCSARKWNQMWNNTRERVQRRGAQAQIFTSRGAQAALLSCRNLCVITAEEGEKQKTSADIS